MKICKASVVLDRYMKNQTLHGILWTNSLPDYFVQAGKTQNRLIRRDVKMFGSWFLGFGSFLILLSTYLRDYENICVGTIILYPRFNA